MLISEIEITPLKNTLIFQNAEIMKISNAKKAYSSLHQVFLGSNTIFSPKCRKNRRISSLKIDLNALIPTGMVMNNEEKFRLF